MSFIAGLNKIAKSEKEVEHDSQVSGAWGLLHPIAAGVASSNRGGRFLHAAGGSLLGAIGGGMAGSVVGHGVGRVLRHKSHGAQLAGRAIPRIAGSLVGNYYGGKAGHRSGVEANKAEKK
jgi:uncharacterized protein YcfJ